MSVDPELIAHLRRDTALCKVTPCVFGETGRGLKCVSRATSVHLCLFNVFRYQMRFSVFYFYYQCTLQGCPMNALFGAGIVFEVG